MTKLYFKKTNEEPVFYWTGLSSAELYLFEQPVQRRRLKRKLLLGVSKEEKIDQQKQKAAEDQVQNDCTQYPFPLFSS